MKQLLINALVITGLLLDFAGAQENSKMFYGKNTVTAGLASPASSSIYKVSAPGQVSPRQTEAGYLPGDGDDTIVVDVWSSADRPKEADPTKLSGRFAAAALNVTSRLQFTERRIANSIRMGFPLGEFWIQTDLDVIDDSLRLASVAITNDADRQTLEQLVEQTNRLRLWCDWLIDQNRNLRLANYYISPGPLDSDERFQNTVACTNFLRSMVASGRVAEDRSCR